jgi:hypothetical protein
MDFTETRAHQEVSNYPIPDHHKETALAVIQRLMTVTDEPGTYCTDQDEDCQADQRMVGIYMDSGAFYADLEINQDGKSFSMYTRSRDTNEEGWVDSFTVNDMTDEWLKTNVGALYKEQTT